MRSGRAPHGLDGQEGNHLAIILWGREPDRLGPFALLGWVREMTCMFFVPLGSAGRALALLKDA